MPDVSQNQHDHRRKQKALGLSSLMFFYLLLSQWNQCQGSKNIFQDFPFRCPHLWKYYRNNCYYFSMKKRDWASGLKFCKEKDSEYVIFKNVKEMRSFQRLLNENYFWVGLRKTDGWAWEDGSLLIDFRIFTNAGVQKCAAVNQYGLHASSCEVPLQWICKKPSY